MGRTRIDKVLSYRDLTGASQDAHVAHWSGFRWQTGPVIVASVGEWGTVQVWAASAAEGKRVIRHAGAIGGWDPDDADQGEWIVTEPRGSRYGRRAEVGVKIRAGLPLVSKRDGPNGAPFQ